MAKTLFKEKNVTPPGGGTAPIVIQKIEVRPVSRTEQDIPKWRKALQSAEARTPRRTLLYDLYADVVLDGHVEAVIGKRIDAVTTANWQFVDKEGKPVDEINNVIDSVGFDDLVAEIINSKFWGYSIMEPQFWKNHSGKWEVSANLLPRLNYRPHLGIVAYQALGDDGINIREGIYAKTVMEVGNPKDLGLLLKAAQYAILKRGGVGDYAMFVQVFGRPIIDAVWDGFDEAQRVQLQESLNIGAGGVIVRPDGTQVNLMDGANGQSTIHNDFIKFLNKEISKSLLGTTETVESSDTSGYAQSKTHGEQDDNKHESDITFTRKVLNSRFIKVLEAAGFNTQGGEFMIQGDEVDLDKKENYEIHKSLVTDLNLPVEDDFFYETYSIPKPENYEALKKEREAIKQSIQNAKTEDPEANKKVDPKKANEDPEEDEVKLSWYKRIVRFFLNAPAETTGATLGHHHTINLGFTPTHNDDELIRRIYATHGKMTFDFALFNNTIKSLLKGFKKGWHKDFTTLSFAPGFEYDIDDPMLLTAFEQNLFKFAGAKTLAQIQALNELFRKSKSFSEFYNEAIKLVGVYNKDWLETEYNTAVLTGEAAATYHRLIKQVHIFPYWEYKTVGDEHVRHSHQLLEGLILPANDPRWLKIFPPNGWNCRCYVAPRLPNEFDVSKLAQMQAKADTYINSPAFAKEAAQGWGVNRGAIGEVFAANQMYVHKFPGMSSKLLNKLGASDFDLQSYSQAKKVASTEVPEFENTVTEWFDALEIVDDLKVLRDYNKRPLLVNTSNVNAIVAEQGDKGKLLAGLEELLKSPDEVWLNGTELEDLVYIKYYKGKTLIALAKVLGGKLELNTWFVLQEVKKVINTYRRGLLVFGK